MSAIKNGLLDSLNDNWDSFFSDNKSLEGMQQLDIHELDDINNIIGTQLGFEMAKLKPDTSKILKYQTLMGKIVIMKTELNHHTNRV
tara:strand:+ start:375 stop:635 length:261 start_codon:yes stop_codon:yes gene_type:complete